MDIINILMEFKRLFEMIYESNDFGKIIFDKSVIERYKRGVLGIIDDYKKRHSDEDVGDMFSYMIRETFKNLKLLRQRVERVVENLPKEKYNGSRIMIIPHISEEYFLGKTRYNFYEPLSSSSCHILVGNKNASFMWFMDEDSGRYVVDDVLEMGDDEDEYFFNDLEQQDYYMLVRLFKNPNLFVKKVLIWLFSARPVEDRKFYETEEFLPKGIFLTKDLNFALNFSKDYNMARDIWKFRIDKSDLVEMDSHSFMTSIRAKIFDRDLIETFK